MHYFSHPILLSLLSLTLLSVANSQAEEPKLFQYLKQAEATMICYTPAELDPRMPNNHKKLKTSSLEADLKTLRTTFDGLILYGYDESVTPRICYLAKKLKFKSIILGVWSPKNSAEIQGVAILANQYAEEFALGIILGNEGLTFNRYEPEDLHFAADYLKRVLKKPIPFATTEPLVGYQHAFLLEFGDFLAPNIHPVFDQPQVNAVEAAAWARTAAIDLAKKSKLPLLLKETGFPHAGKEKYTPQTQADFWQAYLKPGKQVDLPEQKSWLFFGVAFEAFDLPWKSEASGLAIEKSWGLFDTKRQPYPAVKVWSGSVNKED